MSFKKQFLIWLFALAFSPFNIFWMVLAGLSYQICAYQWRATPDPKPKPKAPPAGGYGAGFAIGLALFGLGGL